MCFSVSPTSMDSNLFLQIKRGDGRVGMGLLWSPGKKFLIKNQTSFSSQAWVLKKLNCFNAQKLQIRSQSNTSLFYNHIKRNDALTEKQNQTHGEVWDGVHLEILYLWAPPPGHWSPVPRGLHKTRAVCQFPKHPLPLCNFLLLSHSVEPGPL